MSDAARSNLIGHTTWVALIYFDTLKYEIWKCKLYYGRLNPIAWIP